MTELAVIYGISNCDTVKKARRWLDTASIDYRFVDFRKEGIDPELVAKWLSIAGVDTLLNKRSTSWRSLTEQQQSLQTDAQVVALLCSEPTLIKRPVLVNGEQLQIGFNPAIYQSLFNTP